MTNTVRSSRGQAAVETMISMMLLLLFLWGAVHIATFSISKYVASYGAFYGARTAMVRGDGSIGLGGQAGLAARQGMLNWGPCQMFGIPGGCLFYVTKSQKTYRGVSRDVVKTTSGLNMYFPSLLFVYGTSPVTIQPDISETGDNQ